MNARAELLLHVLSVCLRALTTRQAMRLLEFEDEANFRRFLRGPVSHGLVSVVTAWAKPVPPMTEPLLRSEDFREGDFGRVLRRAYRRWAGVPEVPLACLAATAKAGRLHGVRRTGMPAKPLQLTHDLALSGAFLQMCTSENSVIEHWRGEDAGCCRVGAHQVDAVIIGGEGHPAKAIECVGGDYSEHKLRSIHREWQGSYELW